MPDLGDRVFDLSVSVLTDINEFDLRIADSDGTTEYE